MPQLKKHIRKQSKAYLRERAQAFINHNPSDQSAIDALSSYEPKRNQKSAR